MFPCFFFLDGICHELYKKYNFAIHLIQNTTFCHSTNICPFAKGFRDMMSLNPGAAEQGRQRVRWSFRILPGRRVSVVLQMQQEIRLFSVF